MSVRSATEARASLPELLDRVQAGEEVTITRHGRPVAVLVRPDALRVRRADDAYPLAPSVREELDKGRARPLSEAGSLSPEEAEVLIADIRKDRDAG